MGNLIAATRSTRDVTEVWDTATGERVATLSGHTGAVRTAASSQDGSRLATTGNDGTVRIWDPRSGHMGAVRTAAFSQDGSRLATTGNDGTVRIWDPRTGEQMLVLRGHIAAGSSVAFSPDGSQLLSAGGEGIARVWALDLDDLIEIARGELTQTVTDEECRQYSHMTTCPSP